LTFLITLLGMSGAMADVGSCTTDRPPRALIDIIPAVPQSW
jgi:hypothetical protein